MKEKTNKKITGFRIIRKSVVNTPESLMTLRPGEEVSVDCREFSSLSTALSAASRLNKHAGRVEFNVWSSDNGATLNIRRNSYDSGQA